MTTYKVVGKPAARADGPPKVTGDAKYTVDISLPGMLFGKSVRSPHPHAHIVSIDTSQAEALAGVHGVLTGQDVLGHRLGNRVQDVPLLAEGLVRYAGEKVAAVAAEDEETAQRACDLIAIEYEVLKPLLDPEVAMQDGAPLLHPDMLSYEGYVRPAEKPSNRFFQNTYGTGDIETGFAEADLVFEDEFTTQRIHPAFFEPRACVVDADRDGRVQIWTSSKAPHGVKRTIAKAIKLDMERVLINPTFVGGDFGGKGCPWDEPLCYFLSLKTGRPVKMVMDYTEEFMAGNPRHESIIRVRTGVKNDGTLTAHHQVALFNSGAYAGEMPLGFLAGADRIAANFKIPHARFDVNHVYTNNIPGGYMRGPGEAQGSFAIESHMDEVARKMGMDPAEFRRKNILKEGDVTPMDEVYQGVRAEQALDAVIEAAGFNTPKPPNVGRGLSMCARPAGSGETHLLVTIEPSGSVLVRTPIFEQGSGTWTILSQVVAEVLGTTLESIRVAPWDTDGAPNDSGVAGSRTVRMAVPAANDAALAAKAELLNVTAELLGWPVETLVSVDGTVRRSDNGESVAWADVLSRVPDRVVAGRAESKQQGNPEYTSFGAQVAEVSVDPETGRVELLSFVTAHDTGTVLNPMGHAGQINGAVLTGIGYALMEELKVEDGKVSTLSFADVKVPSISDIPPLQRVLVESEDGTGPFNAKAIGEAPLLGVAPAIANALRDVTGVRFHSLPITAEKVLAALRAKKP
jgi:CO/xanthine dehydrogenase Mo-binding subunit